jgi:hypothetical protein
VCGHHAVLRTLVGKAFLQGFFWPTAVADAHWSCALARGANSTRARPISQRMPSKRFPSHGLSPWGGGVGHHRAPVKGARGLHSLAGCHR